MSKPPKRPTTDNRSQESGLSDAVAPYAQAASPDTKPVWVKLGPGGRIVVPVAMRKALGLGEGAYVQVRLHGEELRVVPHEVALRRVQELVARYAADDGRSWTDELIEERKREVEREARGE
jgi:bifunctional DNA-binding transcriptional regulator/antitoxin component of YhaV-PrlF toxin-antitoxin module